MTALTYDGFLDQVFNPDFSGLLALQVEGRGEEIIAAAKKRQIETLAKGGVKRIQSRIATIDKHIKKASDKRAAVSGVEARPPTSRERKATEAVSRRIHELMDEKELMKAALVRAKELAAAPKKPKAKRSRGGGGGLSKAGVDPEHHKFLNLRTGQVIRIGRTVYTFKGYESRGKGPSVAAILDLKAKRGKDGIVFVPKQKNTMFTYMRGMVPQPRLRAAYIEIGESVNPLEERVGERVEVFANERERAAYTLASTRGEAGLGKLLAKAQADIEKLQGAGYAASKDSSMSRTSRRGSVDQIAAKTNVLRDKIDLYHLALTMTADIAKRKAEFDRKRKKPAAKGMARYQRLPVGQVIRVNRSKFRVTSVEKNPGPAWSAMIMMVPLRGRKEAVLYVPKSATGGFRLEQGLKNSDWGADSIHLESRSGEIDETPKGRDYWTSLPSPPPKPGVKPGINIAPRVAAEVVAGSQADAALTERKKMPPFMKSCVAQVTAQGHDTSAAFAICTKTMQKAGYIEPGADQRELTDKGKTAAKSHAAKKTYPARVAAYKGRLKNEESCMRCPAFSACSEAVSGAPDEKLNLGRLLEGAPLNEGALPGVKAGSKIKIGREIFTVVDGPTTYRGLGADVYTVKGVKGGVGGLHIWKDDLASVVKVSPSGRTRWGKKMPVSAIQVL